MRVHYPTIRFNLGATLCLALAAAMVTVAVPAQAEEAVPLDTKIIRNVLESLGLKRPGEAEINYQERAPLVIPPEKELPAPQVPGAAIANNPAWPKDPDVTRAKVEAAMERNRDVFAEIERDRKPLLPDQLAPGPAPSRRTVATSGHAESNPGNYHRRLTPNELGYRGGLFGKVFGFNKDEESAKFTGPPPRTALTEPPSGYQMPSPDQPYGLGKTVELPKAENSYVTRGEAR